MLTARSGTEKNNNSFVIGLVTLFFPIGIGDFFTIYITKATQATAIDARYAYVTPRKDNPNKTTAIKKRRKRTGLKIFWKYTRGSTLPNPLKIDIKTSIKTVKGIAIENIFMGVDNSGV
jgi:hypothetical protein